MRQICHKALHKNRGVASWISRRFSRITAAPSPEHYFDMERPGGPAPILVLRAGLYRICHCGGYGPAVSDRSCRLADSSLWPCCYPSPVRRARRLQDIGRDGKQYGYRLAAGFISHFTAMMAAHQFLHVLGFHVIPVFLGPLLMLIHRSGDCLHRADLFLCQSGGTSATTLVARLRRYSIRPAWCSPSPAVFREAALTSQRRLAMLALKLISHRTR